MVLLTIATNSNPHTLYFDHQIEKPSYIRLLSASIYNSWYNLEENGIMSVRVAQGGNSQNSGVSITARHYTPENMAKTITETFKNSNIDITVDTRTSIGVMNILNPKNKYTFTLSLDVKGMRYTLEFIVEINKKGKNLPSTIMSSANVLSSAPEYTEQLYPMQEITQINAEDFRLKKISDLQTELSNEADHYRQVAKKKNSKEHTP